MISLFPFFNNINISPNYYKLYIPRIFPDDVFINSSIFSQQHHINADNYNEYKCIKSLSIYKILLDAFMIIKNDSILTKNILFHYVDIIDNNLVIHLSPYIKFLMSNFRNDRLTQLFTKLIDHNLINFVKNDNFIKSRGIISDKEYQLEKIILTISFNIIQMHINIYNNNHTNITNLFQYCQYDSCTSIASHENMCILHKISTQHPTLLSNIYNDYPIDNNIICNTCSNKSNDVIYAPRDYVPICSCCINKNMTDSDTNTDGKKILNGIKKL